MDWDPDEIIAIYRQRWEIELLFKQIELPAEILLRGECKRYQDTDMGDTDSKPVADDHVERP